MPFGKLRNLSISGTVDDCTMHIRETIALYHAYCKIDNMHAESYQIKPFLKTEPCSTGEFYSPASNSCVIECPCGMYGDMQTAMCKQGTLFMVTEADPGGFNLYKERI